METKGGFGASEGPAPTEGGRGPGACYSGAAVAFDFDTVRAEGLVRLYGATRALAGVDLTLRAGQVTVLEGPNGSGKSTLLRLLGLRDRPTRGALWFGSRPARSGDPAARARIGLLGHESMLLPELSTWENLRWLARLHGLGHPEPRLRELGERLGLGRWAERPVGTCSRGQRQRAALARALLHAPRLLLLDEPATGLDAASVQRLVRVVRAERARGAIVVVVSHDPELVGQVADRRLQLRRGRIAEEHPEHDPAPAPGRDGAEGGP